MNIQTENQEKDCETDLKENNHILEDENKNDTIVQELNYKEHIYKKLKEYHLIKSKEENTKPYAIFTNAGIEEIIKEKPKTICELKLIRGFGNVKCEKYGEDIVRIVRECCIYSLDEKRELTRGS